MSSYFNKDIVALKKVLEDHFVRVKKRLKYLELFRSGKKTPKVAKERARAKGCALYREIFFLAITKLEFRIA